MIQLFFILALTVQVSLAGSDCICASAKECRCQNLNAPLPTCAPCQQCQDDNVWETCTNIYKGSQTGTLTLDGGINCLIIDGEEVTGNINGGGDSTNECIRLMNGAKLIGDLKGQWGSDCIEILDSEVTGKITGDSQENCFRIKDSTVREVDMGDTADCLAAVRSTMGLSSTSKAINGKSGNDCILVRDSTVTGNIDASNGDDCIEITGSTVVGDKITALHGVDIVYLKDTIAATSQIEGDSGEDIIGVIGSHVLGVDGGWQNDEITVTTSTAGEVTGGGGDDELIVCDNDSITLVNGGDWATDICASDEDLAHITNCAHTLACYTFKARTS